MTSDGGRALHEALRRTPLESRLSVVGAPFLDRRSAGLPSLGLSRPLLGGLARVLASSAEASRFLALRPELVSRLATADATSLEKRGAELAGAAPIPTPTDLEGFLDAIRLFRRDETVFAACLDLGGVVPFEAVSRFLSLLAEALIERALEAAVADSPEAAVRSLAVLGMGKLAGHELTYHSDLDLIFLYRGDASAIVSVSRTAQRLIHYLGTPTGAGTAYAVDARLRPSGRQGMLVTSLEAFADYQLRQAQVWEHLALVRGRAIAGDRAPAELLVRRVQREVCARHMPPWPEVARLRARIVAERARESGGRIAFKTGEGGLMDATLLAAGTRLECGLHERDEEPPSVPAMLSGVRGRAVDELLEAYRFLRLVEARTRWAAGRAAEELRTSPDTLPVVAELVEPRLAPDVLLERIAAARGRIRAAAERVLAAGTARALAGGPSDGL